MSKHLHWSIPCILLFLLQLLLSASVELAHDEAYYWLYSRHLDWGYFDHPPLVGVTIWLFSFLPHDEVSLRLGFILQQVLSLYLLLKLLPREYHWQGSLLFISFPLVYFSGILALPDMPLLFMSALYFFALREYFKKDSWGAALALGLIIPALLYAKYHGILLIFFTLLALPKLLVRKSFYLIALMSILLFLPHVIWQYQHDFSTLRYHFLERPKSAFSFKRSLEYLGLQIGLAGLLAGPVVWWAVIKRKASDDFDRVMKFCGIGIVVFFFLSTFSKKFEANWSLPASIPLIYLAAQSEYFKRWWGKALLMTSGALIVGVALVLMAFSDQLPVKRLKEFHGWRAWAREVQQRCQSHQLMANSYQIASKLSYYLETEIPSLNYHSRKNHFDYWRFDQAFTSGSVCYITDKGGFVGEEVMTPEGKRLKLVQTTLQELLTLKAEQDNQN